MKRAMRAIAALAVVLWVSGSALAVVTLEGDTNPAPFRNVENPALTGYTLQAWTFSNEADPSAPDVSINPNGEASADLIGGFFQNTVWLENDLGHQGVWIIDRGEGSDMMIRVPNYPPQNPIKKIWLQVVFNAQENKAPNVFVLPEGDDTQPIPRMELVELSAVDNSYMHATYSLELPFNPTWEYIFIRPRDCQVYIDTVIAETQCIPEPMTLIILGLGSLLLRKRR